MAVTQQDIDTVKKLRKLGLTYAEVKERSGLSLDQVQRIIMGRYKLTRADLKWTPEIVNEWRELRRQRWKIKDIAAKYKTKASTVGAKLAEQL